MAIKLNKKQNGFALIFVLVFIAMIMGVVGDVVYQTQVSARGTAEERSILDAQTSAITGVEFAKLLINLNSLSEKYQGNPLIPIPKKMYSLMNGQPIGSSALKKLEEFSGADILNKVDPHIQKALDVVPGYFVLNISSENSKFNLNTLQANNSADAQKALLRLFSSPDSLKFIESLGYTPQQLVDNLTSYIKILPTTPYSQNDYDKIEAKYKPKNAALESLEEIRRIPGFHLDDIFNMYSPYFTIWPISGIQGTININSAPIELIATLLTPDAQEIVDQNWDQLEEDLDRAPIQQKANEWFSNNLNGFKNDHVSEKIANFFGNNDNIFKVESRGVANGVEKTLVIVFQLNDSNKNDTKNTTNQKANSAPKFTVIYSSWK